MPIFNRPFSQIAKGYVDLQSARVGAGRITQQRLKVVECVIGVQLNRYVGSVQINLIGQDYLLWRQKTRKWRNGHVRDAAIRYEISIFDRSSPIQILIGGIADAALSGTSPASRRSAAELGVSVINQDGCQRSAAASRRLVEQMEMPFSTSARPQFGDRRR